MDDAPDIARILCEAGEKARIAADNVVNGVADLVRCLERVAEHMRRYAAWVEEFRPPVTWTSERPTVPGWYWVRYVDAQPEKTVENLDADDIRRIACGWYKSIAAYAGPIPEPAEPAKEGGGG